MTKKPRKAKTRAPQKRTRPLKREGQRPPRIIDLRDYSTVGRPTIYRPEFARVAEKMAQGGSTDLEIANALGCAPATLYRWKAEIPEFRESIAGAKQIPSTRVERALYHRAVGFVAEHDELLVDHGKITVVKMTKHHPPETAAARLWLHNQDPQRWRPRNEPEPPAPTDAAADPVEELTDEEIDAGLARIAANRRARAQGLKPSKKRAAK